MIWIENQEKNGVYGVSAVRVQYLVTNCCYVLEGLCGEKFHMLGEYETAPAAQVAYEKIKEAIASGENSVISLS